MDLFDVVETIFAWIAWAMRWTEEGVNLAYSATRFGRDGQRGRIQGRYPGMVAERRCGADREEFVVLLEE